MIKGTRSYIKKLAKTISSRSWNQRAENENRTKRRQKWDDGLKVFLSRAGANRRQICRHLWSLGILTGDGGTRERGEPVGMEGFRGGIWAESDGRWAGLPAHSIYFEIAENLGAGTTVSRQTEKNVICNWLIPAGHRWRGDARAVYIKQFLYRGSRPRRFFKLC